MFGSGNVWVLVPVVAIVAWAIVEIAQRRSRDSDARDASAEREALLRDELAALRQRIEVLERIVTDRGYDLKEEIERLRTGS